MAWNDDDDGSGGGGDRGRRTLRRRMPLLFLPFLELEMLKFTQLQSLQHFVVCILFLRSASEEYGRLEVCLTL